MSTHAGALAADYAAELSEAPALANASVVRPRSQPLWFAPSVFLSAMSWSVGGIAVINDVAMVFFLAACVSGCIYELKHFRRDIGLGGLVLYGGSIIWFCHDYFVNWFGINYQTDPTVLKFFIPAATVAKGVFLVSLFIMAGSLGIRISRGQRLVKLMSAVPEPAGSAFMPIIFATMVVGLIPYLFFTEENPLVALAKDMVAMRGQAGARWTIAGRTGNYNYNWSPYLMHFLEIGQVGAILAACYATLVCRNVLAKVVCWSIWLMQAALAFGSGTRGPLVAMGLPVLGVIFAKMWFLPSGIGRWQNRVTVVLLGFALLFAIQFQGTYRNAVAEERDFYGVELFKSQGNLMFTEGLVAYDIVPSMIAHPGERFPGASVIRPLPEIAFRFAFSWFPRALWHDKPATLWEFLGMGPDFDFFLYYNALITGGSGNSDNAGNFDSGGTAATSIVGMAYIPYGVPGVIQIGVLFGWLCALAERAFRQSNGRIMASVFALGFTAYLARAFRELTPHDLYPLLIGIAGAAILTKLLSPNRGADTPDAG